MKPKAKVCGQFPGDGCQWLLQVTCNVKVGSGESRLMSLFAFTLLHVQLSFPTASLDPLSLGSYLGMHQHQSSMDFLISSHSTVRRNCCDSMSLWGALLPWPGASWSSVFALSQSPCHLLSMKHSLVQICDWITFRACEPWLFTHLSQKGLRNEHTIICSFFI